MSRPASPSFLPFANRIAKGTSLNDKLRVAFAAGYVEGAMTSSRTWQHWQNFLKRPVWKQRIPFSRWKLPSASLGLSKTLHILSVSVSDALLLIQVETRSLDYCSKSQHRFAYDNDTSPEYLKAKDFLVANDNFVRGELNRSYSDEYWTEMAIIWAQLDGLVAGNAATCGTKCLDLNVFLFLQAEQDPRLCVSMCFMCFHTIILGFSIQSWAKRPVPPEYRSIAGNPKIE